MDNVYKRTYILIPSYEPDENLIPLVNSLKELGFEIILVNDGSDESYDEIFNQVKDKVHYLKQTPNRGKGQALRYGFSYANIHNENMDFVITCDGDGQHSIKDITRVNNALIKYNRPIFGCRKFDKNTPKRSRTGNFMSRLCRTMITKDYISDDQSGLRGFPMRFMNELITITGDHYEYEMNVICTFQLKRYKYKEIPIETIYLNNNENSHFAPKLDTFRIQRVIWVYDVIPLIVYLLTLMAYSITNALIYEHVPSWMTCVAALSFGVCLYFGLFSLFFPTKQVGKRAMIEGMFYSLKASVAFGIFVLLHYVANWWSPVCFFIATFLVCFLNFPIAYLIYQIKMKGHTKGE